MKNVRTLVVGMIAGAVLATAGSAYGASAIQKVTAMVRPDYKVKVDGQAVSMQHAPLTYNGTTYVPLRDAGEILGYNVGFDAGTISLDQKEGTTVTEPTTTPEPTSTPAPTDDPIASIDMSEWVSEWDLKNSYDFELGVGLRDGDTPSSKVRQVTLKYKDKVETWVTPSVIVGDYLTTNENGIGLLYKGTSTYFQKSFIESFFQ